MFGEPSLAHPAERGGVHTTGQPHTGNEDDRDRHDDEADNVQHRVLAVTRFFLGVSRSLHFYSRVSVRLCTGLECVDAVAPCGLYVHSGTAPFSPGAYSYVRQLVSLDFESIQEARR